MRACIIRKYGNNDVLEYTNLQPEPTLHDHEILVQMKAASVNPIDWKVMEGKAKMVLKYKFPLVLGNDGAGTVVKTGKDVTQFKIGDEVFFRPSKTRIGTFAEFCAVSENEAALKPKNLNFEEAAGIPLAGLTSWQALFDYGRLEKGQKVLIHAGSGGVGSLAVQFAKNAGAFTIATCSTRNIDLVKSLGADQVIDYTKEKFTDILKDVDIVFDTIGGQAKYDSFKVMKPGGTLISIQSVPTPKSVKDYGLNPVVEMLLGILSLKSYRYARKYKVNYHYLFMKADGKQLNEIKNLIEEGKVKPVVDRVFNFDQIKEAFAYQQTGRARGKIIIRI
ncbi:MAG TPA: NADP-dependent oxidoreductase [Leptospiraceae bacterium]|nr:NADP-dependent oxidoreductase [Leptospiraceae bacterium]HMZ59012.1 NADP-dependent oxidoreductase [Leptospiraceae bacterium]